MTLAEAEDSSYLEYIEAVEYLIKENKDKFSKKNIDKLNKWVKESRMILEKTKEAEEKEKDQSPDQILEDQIYENLSQRNENFNIVINNYYPEERILEIFQNAIQEDKYFYYAIYKSANISTNYYDDTDQNGYKYIDSVDFTMAYRQDAEVEQKTEEFIDQRTKENIKENMDQLEKVRLIHDFIVTKNNYNTGDADSLSGGYSVYTPASILFGQGGVCNAYATLFDKMATKAGLESYYVTGKIIEENQLHIWNMVKIKDDRYNLDLTWDDPILESKDKILNKDEFVSYKYFLISDENMLKTRTQDPDPQKPPSVKDYNHNFQDTKLKFGYVMKTFFAFFGEIFEKI